MTQPSQRLKIINSAVSILDSTGAQSIEFQRFIRDLCQIVNFQSRLAPPSVVTVTASPFHVQNTTSNDETILVQGGTVSKIEFSRDGTTYYNLGQTSGMFALSPLDFLRVTYTVAPTVTAVVR